MTTIARKNVDKFGAGEGAIDIESIAVQKDNRYKEELTAWIFQDGSAITMDSHKIVKVVDDYGLHCDYEVLFW